MIVAYYIYHNDIDQPLTGIIEQDGVVVSESDLYEASVEIRTFATRDEAEAWLDEIADDEDLYNDDLEEDDAD